MGSGKGKTRRAQTATTAVAGKTLEEAGIVRLTTAQSSIEENIIKHAQELGVDILVDGERSPWAASANSDKFSGRGKPYIFIAPLESSLSELIALHELGHIAQKHSFKVGDQEEVRCEHEAWQWALTNYSGEVDAEVVAIAGTVMLRRILVAQKEDGYPLPEPSAVAWGFINGADYLNVDILPEPINGYMREDLAELGLSEEDSPELIVKTLQGV